MCVSWQDKFYAKLCWVISFLLAGQREAWVAWLITKYAGVSGAQQESSKAYSGWQRGGICRSGRVGRSRWRGPPVGDCGLEPEPGSSSADRRSAQAPYLTC